MPLLKYIDGVATGIVSVFFTLVSTLTTAGNLTLTAAQIVGGLILRDCNGAGRSDTTPTAAQLAAFLRGQGLHEFDGPDAGHSFIFTIRNTSGGAFTHTLLAGTGVTLSGTMTIAQNNQKSYLVVFTNTKPGSEACTIYSLGTVVF